TGQLKQLYQQLLSLAYQPLNTVEEKREQYRLNIFCSTVQWLFQTKTYLKLRKMDAISPLIAVLTGHENWLRDHHLEVRDATKKIGDCLFDNILAQVGGSASKTADEFRKEMVYFMRVHSDEYQSKPDYHDQNFLEVGDGSEELVFNDWDSYLDRIVRPQALGHRVRDSRSFHAAEAAYCLDIYRSSAKNLQS
ncbi:MAG: hypothetical protein ACRDFB_03985, partial [Rhabdochlamydiaceae bacterium]